METEPRWLSAQEQEAWAGLQQMQGMLSGRLNRELSSSSGLSLQDYGVLVTVNDAADGRVRAFELGHLMGWEKSRLSHHIARMEERGLVRRERCPSDARGLFVVLTVEGRTALEQAAPGHVESVRRWFVDRLTPPQLATLADIARTVKNGLAGACDEE
ncbi:MAG: MarR family winged helix-turn-helix transcriptional regulator [Acidimicrobiales bacterium]